ncbi:hypothetical protein PAAG_07538 [Paracoccidioides lutzii Pb01]|uniref:Uncharacterized protein n=1 Tax=Paracoccidioides lutzii (strain ATCC MYA-826 / Pb01) TaxID=502779 RepID=C1H9U7_PARBA|nr:hypothetical protein PAAG_07538 [Paracoccidioides lutzii Pb01]EEH37120.2 hypothetical protein PAAG_07538 [Paracoccidioides lutzii Pb01]
MPSIPLPGEPQGRSLTDIHGVGLGSNEVFWKLSPSGWKLVLAGLGGGERGTNERALDSRMQPNRHSVNDKFKAIGSEDAVIDSRITIGYDLIGIKPPERAEEGAQFYPAAYLDLPVMLHLKVPPASKPVIFNRMIQF